MITEIVRESKNLLKEIDDFIRTAKEAKNLGINALSFWSNKKEYYGEVVEYDDTVVVTQEVGIGFKPKVDYIGDEIIIRFGNNEKRYKVGCLDRNTLEATLSNGVLTVKGKKCKEVNYSDRKGEEPAENKES